MPPEPQHLASAFYATRQGEVAARLLRDRLAMLWPSVERLSVLGLGYAAPYLQSWRERAARCIAARSTRADLARWPEGLPGLTCAVVQDALPFADLEFDRVLLVHGLEAAEDAGRLLREVWRVLKDDGRILIVAPNRVGLWAHVESTPFGQGQPYSPGQIGRLLAGQMFRVERCDTALYLPPTGHRAILRSADLFEASGRRVAPSLAGVTITEAVKDVWAAIPVAVSPDSSPSSRRVLADAA